MKQINEAIDKLKDISESLNSMLGTIDIDKELDKIKDPELKEFLSSSANEAKKGTLNTQDFVRDLKERTK